MLSKGVSISNGHARTFSLRWLFLCRQSQDVSIPNGHPRPFSRSDDQRQRKQENVSIPNGHPRPFSPLQSWAHAIPPFLFQFLTDIPGHLPIKLPASVSYDSYVSIPNKHPRPLPSAYFLM